MPNYFYTAKSFEGKDNTGMAFAKDIHELARNLKNENLILVDANAEGERKKIDLNNLPMPFSGIKAVDRIMMTRNLWIMFGAGLSLGKIFDILAGQARKKKLKDVLTDIKERLNKGDSFSDALKKHPKVFNDFFQSMVKIGEEAGTLEEIFEILSVHMDREHELKSKIRGALIYPCVILIVMGGIGVVVAIFVIPKFSAFLIGMNVPLPIYTRILIGTGELAQKFWYMALVLPIVLVTGLKMAMRTKAGKWTISTVLMHFPLLAPFIKKSNATVVIRSLSSLNSSGIPLIRSLEITSSTASNVYFKKALAEAIEKVKKGEKLSTALKPYSKIFPFGALDMMEVGEETGKTSMVLKKLAEFYEQEVIEETKNFSIIIEPILLVFLGLVVAFFAISVIEPMYSSLKVI